MMKILRTISLLILIFISLSTPIYSQEYSDNRFKAVINNIRYEVSDDIQFTIYSVEILDGDNWGNQIDIYTTEDSKGVEVKEYSVGDKVIVLSSESEGDESYFIIDHVRTTPIITLTIIFITLTIFIGGKLGIQSIIGLILSTIILLTIIIPTIERGGNILLTTLIGSCFIGIISIYLSHGFNRKSSIALIGTLVSILLTFILAIIFTNLFKLTGYSTEESMYIISYDELTINMKNLLIASLIFGGIGILDDVTVSQVSVVNELVDANIKLPSSLLYKKAMNVGRDHISSMVNTLFLAYASASLPLLILLRLQSASLFEIINNEVISEEILRTLVGSIGLILAVPITTILAVYFYKKQKTN